MTFTIRIRGGGGPILAEYVCPDHGRFDALVERDAGGNPPEIIDCPTFFSTEEAPRVGRVCRHRAEHAISAPAVHTQFVVSASHGKNDPKPTPYALDTRPLAEGQSVNEWRKERRKMWEGERHRRVKELLE